MATPNDDERAELDRFLDEIGEDALALLAAYHQRTQGKIYDLLTGPDVSAQFSTWHG